MRVLDRSVYRGPHLYSATPMIRFALDLGALDERPTSTLPGFADALLERLPGLELHGCSRGRPGGLVERLREGTWIGHVVEHVALELQTSAGSPVTRGKTRSVKGSPGVYNVLYAYTVEAAGLLAGRQALDLVASLLPQEFAQVEGLDLLTRDGDEDLARLVQRAALGPTTQSIADAARRRGIPVERLDEQSLLRLGWGSRQKLVRASITSETSHLGVLNAGNKDLAKSLLASAGIPVPRGTVVRTADEAVTAAARIRGPVVTKPLDGNHGRGVTLDLIGDEAVRRGFEEAARHSRRVVVEEQFRGRDYRVLVIGGRVVAVAERMPAQVVGDGVSTVQQLVDRLNADPRRGAGHEKVLTRVVIDDHVRDLLAKQGLELVDVPGAGHPVLLRDTANLSTGGEAADRTDQLHPDNRILAERAAKVIGLDIAGLDIVSPDLSEPLSTTGGGIIEVNAAPGFRMHVQPSEGQPRDVAGPVVDLLYPPGSRSLIPVTAVTGTNGKSTTVRMLGHILARAGLTVGMTTTSGIYVDDNLVKAADASGPRSARLVLADPTVDAAVLETARGGILREGLAFPAADVGIVLNISADHLGLKGVETLEELARVKQVVVQHVRRRGTSILNADDPLTLRMARRARGRLAFLTLRPRSEWPPLLEENLRAGGLVAALEDDALVLFDGDERIRLIDAVDIPATLGGVARFNIMNALAAATAAYVQRVGVPTITDALSDFESTFEQNPGRLNLTRSPGFTTILDYAHNPAALRAIGTVVQRLRGRHERTIGVVSIPGDRRDEDIREMGQIAAGLFDELIFRERPDGRGRQAGGVVALLSEGAVDAGMDPSSVRRIVDEGEAVDAALRSAGPRDLVVVMPTDVDGVWRRIQEFRGSFVEDRAKKQGALHA